MLNRLYLGLAAAAGLAFASAAGAATIGVNFSGGSSEAPVDVTGVAGAKPQGNWNNVAGIGNTSGVLVDSNGTPTGLTVTTTGSNTWNDGEPIDGANGSLLRDFLDGGSGGQDTATVNLPANANYTLYIYMASNQNSQSDFTVNGTTYYAVNDTSGSNVLSAAATTTTNGGGTVGNYIVIPNVTGPLTIVANSNAIGDFRSSLDGIQIDGTVPEPASLGFLGLASLGLLVRRARKA